VTALVGGEESWEAHGVLIVYLRPAQKKSIKFTLLENWD
jgi:hypothetical protein